MPWLQLTLHTHHDMANKISDHLSEQMGAVSVTLQDAADEPLLEPQPGETPLWQAVIVTALFDMAQHPLRIQQALQQAFDQKHIRDIQYEELADQDWERAWLKHFQPMQFGQRLWICPSKHTPPEPEAVNIMLDPGLAFGTGTHPTTALCLTWLDQSVKTDDTLIDYGCGSGILAIAGLKLGCSQAVAVDNDPQALIATQSNAGNNHIAADKLDILPSEAFLATPRQKFDLVVANILAKPLIALAPHLSKLLKPGGRLALSGILEEQVAEVEIAYQRCGIEIDERQQQEQWCLLTGRPIIDHAQRFQKQAIKP